MFSCCSKKRWTKAFHHDFNIAISQISSSSVEWWSSLFWSSRLDLFHSEFWNIYIYIYIYYLFKAFVLNSVLPLMCAAVDGAINHMALSSFELCSSFVCSLRFNLLHCVFVLYKLGPSKVQTLSKHGQTLVQACSKHGPNLAQTWSKHHPNFVLHHPQGVLSP